MTLPQPYARLIHAFKMTFGVISLNGNWHPGTAGFDLVHSYHGIRMGQPVVEDPMAALIAPRLILVKTDASLDAAPDLRATWERLEQAAQTCGIEEAPYGYAWGQDGVYALPQPSDLATVRLGSLE
jgi:hypothetical protein